MNNVVPIGNERSYSASQLSLIRRTVAKDCNNDEFDLFAEVARRTGLDPFRKQIYAFVFSKDKPDKRQLAIVTGIDGYRVIAQRNGDYSPASSPPKIEYDESLKDPAVNPLGIVRAEVTVHKLGPDSQWQDVVGEAYWDEFVPLREAWEYDEKVGKRQPTGKLSIPDTNKAWKTMARVMIGKCAEAQALRRGWPEETSGLYAQEEMDQALAHDANASDAVEAYATEQRLKITNAANTIGFLWEAGQPIESVPLGEIADRCMGFIRQCDSPTQLETWRETNRVGLQEFWARAKADALAVKQEIESRLNELSQPDEGAA